MALWSLLVPLAFAATPADPPAPLTDDQRLRIQRLVRTTQEESTRLKELLDRRQQDLARLYAHYDLDAAAVNSLEKDILDVQRQTLANYRTMQVELRTIVGKDRFEVLRQRLERIINPAGGKPADPGKSPTPRQEK
jgi:hypothetical protein